MVTATATNGKYVGVSSRFSSQCD